MESVHQDIILEAIPEFRYQIDHNPQLQKIDTIKLYTNFVGPNDMEPILTPCSFSCWLPTTEFIEDDGSPKKLQLFCFLKESGVSEEEAALLILKLTELVSELTSSVLYRSDKDALKMWMTFDVFLSSREPILDNIQNEEDIQNEEAIRASLEYFERNIGFKPVSQLGVRSLCRRIYKKKPKTIIIVDNKREQNSKRRSRSIIDGCTICLEDFKVGQEVSSLPCGHDFHNKCIGKWLEINHVCPLCRFALPCED